VYSRDTGSGNSRKGRGREERGSQRQPTQSRTGPPQRSRAFWGRGGRQGRGSCLELRVAEGGVLLGPFEAPPVEHQVRDAPPWSRLSRRARHALAALAALGGRAPRGALLPPGCLGRSFGRSVGRGFGRSDVPRVHLHLSRELPRAPPAAPPRQRGAARAERRLAGRGPRVPEKKLEVVRQGLPGLHELLGRFEVALPVEPSTDGLRTKRVRRSFADMRAIGGRGAEDSWRAGRRAGRRGGGRGGWCLRAFDFVGVQDREKLQTRGGRCVTRSAALPGAGAGTDGSKGTGAGRG